MNSLLKQRLLLRAAGRHLMQEPKSFNFVGLRNGRASYSNSDSLCPPPSPCPPQGDPPPCPQPPPPCGPPCPPPPCAAAPDPCNPCGRAKLDDAHAKYYAEVKRAQCSYLREKGTPTYLKGGKFNVYFFQGCTIMFGVLFIHSLYTIYQLAIKYP